MNSDYINIKYDNPSDYTLLQQKTINMSETIINLQKELELKDKTIKDMQNHILLLNSLITQVKTLVLEYNSFT
jgi:uncharacterized protein YeeX (DUF496 family)